MSDRGNVVNWLRSSWYFILVECHCQTWHVPSTIVSLQNCDDETCHWAVGTPTERSKLPFRCVV